MLTNIESPQLPTNDNNEVGLHFSQGKTFKNLSATSYREMVEGGMDSMKRNTYSEGIKLRDVALTWRQEAVTIAQGGKGSRSPLWLPPTA